jgi:hypothetical protein
MPCNYWKVLPKTTKRRAKVARFQEARKGPVFFRGRKNYDSDERRHAAAHRNSMPLSTETSGDHVPTGGAPPSTPVEPSPSIETPPVVAAPRPSVLVRVVEWFIRRRARASARHAARELPAEQRILLARARSAAEAARRAHEPSGPLVSGPAHAVVLELCRQSVYWSLSWCESVRSNADTREPAERAPDLRELWERSDRELLLRAAGDPEALLLVEPILITGSFREFAELGPSEQQELAGKLLRFEEALRRLLDTPDNALERLGAERARRLGAVGVFVVVGFIASILVAGWLERRADLAVGKPWKTSSMVMGCRSPKQSCGESASFFFQTHEEDRPWIEIDLGSVVNVSAVRVINRKDCCPDRAIPLVVELSSDQKQYREVLRRTRTFMSFRGDFPTQRARWVRVRALRKTWLHLQGVRVLP